MANQEITKLIQKNFPQLATQFRLVEEIATVGTLQSFKAGELIMDYGQYVKLIPLVVEGSIKVVRKDEQGNELFLYFLNSGDTCPSSFSCCTMNKKSNIQTIAEDDTTIIGIPFQKLDSWMAQFPSWKNFIMLAYENRMNIFLQTIDSIAFKKLDERLLDYLEKKSQATNSKVLKATHQQLADDLNASREAISRLLKHLEKEQYLKLERNKILLSKE